MGASKLLISIVDDEEGVRKALRRLFSASDLDAETFPSGRAFLDSIESRRPDCLVLDLHMPGLSGLDVLQQLARSQVCLPTIVITAYDEPETQAQCLTAGAFAYLRKPLDEQMLLAAIANAAKQSVEGARPASGLSDYPKLERD